MGDNKSIVTNTVPTTLEQEVKEVHALEELKEEMVVVLSEPTTAKTLEQEVKVPPVLEELKEEMVVVSSEPTTDVLDVKTRSSLDVLEIKTTSSDVQAASSDINKEETVVVVVPSDITTTSTTTETVVIPSEVVPSDTTSTSTDTTTTTSQQKVEIEQLHIVEKEKEKDDEETDKIIAELMKDDIDDSDVDNIDVVIKTSADNDEQPPPSKKARFDVPPPPPPPEKTVLNISSWKSIDNLLEQEADASGGIESSLFTWKKWDARRKTDKTLVVSDLVFYDCVLLKPFDDIECGTKIKKIIWAPSAKLVVLFSSGQLSSARAYRLKANFVIESANFDSK
jgi:hypothetical protein